MSVVVFSALPLPARPPRFVSRFSNHPEMRQHHRRGQNRAHRVRDVFARDRRRRAVHRLKHGSLPGTDIAAGGHAQPALQPRGQIGDDVAKHVVGDDHIELARISHHLHAERIDVHVLCLICGYSRATSLKTRCHRPPAWVMAFDLSHISTGGAAALELRMPPQYSNA